MNVVFLVKHHHIVTSPHTRAPGSARFWFHSKGSAAITRHTNTCLTDLAQGWLAERPPRRLGFSARLLTSSSQIPPVCPAYTHLVTVGNYSCLCSVCVCVWERDRECVCVSDPHGSVWTDLNRSQYPSSYVLLFYYFCSPFGWWLRRWNKPSLKTNLHNRWIRITASVL